MKKNIWFAQARQRVNANFSQTELDPRPKRSNPDPRLPRTKLLSEFGGLLEHQTNDAFQQYCR